ncbi:unnamed protein product [Peronospora belbahrii]|uniref:Uncharacterized protein n=1 Tax=Peronospora belbahrii TaxID=622444 RepID=A0AAU9LBA6_9STRA|nr:unnamed protein product [Peronospora belbahrii]
MNAHTDHQSVDVASGKPDTKLMNAQAGHQTAGAASRKPDTKISNAQASHQTTDAASAKPDTTIMNAKADHQTTNAASATPDTKLMNAHTDHQSVDAASAKPDTKLMNAQAGHQTAFVELRKDKISENESLESEQFSALARDHFNEDDLINVLAHAAETNEKTKEWLASGQTADAVFTELKLHEKTVKLSLNPVFFTWLAFLAAKGSESVKYEMFSTLAGHFSGNELDDALAFAAMYDLEIREWIAHPKFTKLLTHNLPELAKSDDPFQHKDFLRLYASIAAGDKINLQRDMSLFIKSVSTERQGYGELLVEGSYNTVVNHIFIPLLKSQVVNWSKWGIKDWQKTFIHLRLDREKGGPLFERPQLKIFADYMKLPDNPAMIDQTYDDMKDTFKVMKKVYGTKKLRTLIDATTNDPYGLAAKMGILLSQPEKNSLRNIVGSIFQLKNGGR